MKRKIIVLLAIIVILLVGFLFVFKGKSTLISKKSTSPNLNSASVIKQESQPINKLEAKSVNSKTSRKTISITIQEVKYSDLDVYEKSVGIVYNLDSSFISAETSGIVKSVKVEIGDLVKKGQILAQIDKEELENTRNAQVSEINKIKAQLKDQQTNQIRYKSLYKSGYVSQAELDTINTNVKTLKEQLGSAQSMLANYNIILQKSVIKSKIQGIVQERSVSKGNFVSVGTPLFTIVDNSNLLILANYPQFFSSILKKNQPVVVEIGEGRVINTQIKEIKPIVDSETRSLQIILSLPNNSYKLKPGETVNVSVITQRKTNVIVIKEEAVVLRARGKVVYVINPDNTVDERAITTGVSQNGLVEVKDGLEIGESIAVEGAGFLSNNANIIIIGN
jgi:RND family efflux transporter MFP subunit